MFLPLRDENPTRRIPLVNVLLILINVAVFGYQFMLNQRYPEFKTIDIDMQGNARVVPGGADAVFVTAMGMIPYELTRFTDVECEITRDGIVVSPGLDHYLERLGRRLDSRKYDFSREFDFPFPPNFLTIFTNLFVHGGLMHLLGNMLYLWIFGDNVEDRLGHLRYLLFYLACGLLANAAHLAFNFDSKIPTVGASGAIAGVLGAYFYLFPHARIVCFYWFLFFIRVLAVPASIVLGFWILLQIIQAWLNMGAGAGEGVAWMAHVGGFAAGYLLIRTWFRKRQIRARFY